MESKKGKTKLIKIISYISLIALVFGNNFFVYGSDNSDIMEEVDFFSDQDQDHNDFENNIDTNLLGTRLFQESVFGDEIEIEGILEQVIGEGPNGYMEETYLLYDDSYGKSFVLDLNNIIDDGYVGSRVVLGGFDGDDIFTVKNLLSNQTVLQSSIAALEFTPETKNIRNVAVFMVNVNGNTPIWTKEVSESKIFGDTNSAKEYFKETSYGELDINSDADGDGENDVFGPFNVDGAGKCEYSTWRTQSIQQAIDSGIDVSKYHNIVLILPNYSKIGCNWAGLGNVGSVDSNYTMTSWVAYSSNSVVQHELGHNFGLGHASTDTDNNGSVNSEYGDQSGVMGGPAGMPLKIGVNAPHMDQLNWGDHIDGFYEFATEPVSNYILQPLQLNPETSIGTRVIKFPKKNNNEFYYVSYRQAVGYNSQMYSKYQPGLTIHTYKGSGYANTKLVKKLNNGEIFFDATNNIRITSQGIDEASEGMKVLIETNPGACVKGELGASKLFNTEYLQTNSQGNIDFRFMNNDVDCDEQTLTLTNNPDSELVGTFTSSKVVLHPQDFKETSFVFNTGNQDKEYFYSITASDNDGLTPNHGSFTFTGSVLVDGTLPTTINNLSYTKNASTYKFTWSASLDNGSGIDKYEVHRSTGSGFIFHRTIYSQGESNIVSFDETDLGALKYSYKVYTFDKAGNKSIESNTVVIDNSAGLCIFNGGELILNSRYISTNTGSVHNLPYELKNKNINCNASSFSLSTTLPQGFLSVLDKENIVLNSGDSMTGVLQIQTSLLPGEYDIVFSSQTLDYTDNNKNIKSDTNITFYLNGEYITSPSNLNYIKNNNSYNFSWSGSTYTSIGKNGDDSNLAGVEEGNQVNYELFRSSSSDFNNYTSIYTGINTNFSDTLISEDSYKYYVAANNGKGLSSEKSNIIDLTYTIPENITATIKFNSGSFTNSNNTQIELNSTFFPVNYLLTGDFTSTGTISQKTNLDINLSNIDGLKTLNLQYFGNNGKSKIISDSITLDTLKPTFVLDTIISNTGTTESNILLQGSLNDINGIKSFKINSNDIILNNSKWSTNLDLNIGVNNINYIALDNANNTLTGTLIINRVLAPEEIDNIPDNFTFNNVSNIGLNQNTESNQIIINGINTGSLISIDNGFYSINNGEFTSDNGIIFNNNTLNVKALSSGDYSITTTTTVNVGGVTSEFNITTKSKPSSGGGGGGGSKPRPKPKPKVICTIDEHLVCESNRKGVYKYYKKQGAVCNRGDLGKKCYQEESKENKIKENKGKDNDYLEIKKYLLGKENSLKNTDINLILKKLSISDIENIIFEYNKSEDYSDVQVRKIFLINKDKFNKLKSKLNNIKYLSEDFQNYLYYLEFNYHELNNILSLLEISRIEKNKDDILKYYREYKTISDNITNINEQFNSIGNIKSKGISDNSNISYFKYKNKKLRKKQTILFIKLKRKEFNTDLFIEINKYLHNEYVLLNNGEYGDSNNILYKELLDKISKL